MADTPTFWADDASLRVLTVKTHAPRNPRRRSWGPGFRSPDWETFNRLMDVLSGKGMRFQLDPETAERFPGLAKFNRLGQVETPHGTLWVAAEIYPSGCGFKFFQEVVTVNRNGGRYDFDRAGKMPYLIHKKYLICQSAMVANLESRGFARTLKTTSPNPDPLAYFNDLWDGEYERARGLHRFERGADGWPTLKCVGEYNAIDGDGNTITHGDVRYLRDRKGYLQRAMVYGGINGMWLAVFGPGPRDYAHVHARRLRTISPAASARKLHPSPRRLEDCLSEAVKAQNFERAIILRDLIARRGQEEAANV